MTDDTTDNRDVPSPKFAREGDGQDYIDRSTIDFDPDDGLYSGTVVDGTTDIPGPHEPPAGQADTDTDDAEGAPDGD